MSIGVGRVGQHEVGNALDEHAAIATFARAFCRSVVAFEQRLRHGASATPSARDTPGLGVLVALDQLGPLRPVTITALLGMTTGGATKVVDRVERDGLVRRREGAVPEDRRAVLVALTDAGRQALAGAEHQLAAVGADMVTAVEGLLGPLEATPDPPAPGAAVAALYRFFDPADRAVVEAIGPHRVLEPGDPRGVLVVLEAEHRGGLPLNLVPTLTDRSRAAAHRLVRALVADGLVARRAAPHDRRLVVLVPTGRGQAIARGIGDALAAHRPEWEPPAVDLATALLTLRGRAARP